MKIGFLGLLTLLFVGCKLGGLITWSWWLVLSPLLVGAGLALFFICSAFYLAYKLGD